jgi:hypothetical protein
LFDFSVEEQEAVVAFLGSSCRPGPGCQSGNRAHAFILFRRRIHKTFCNDNTRMSILSLQRREELGNIVGQCLAKNHALWCSILLKCLTGY